MYPQLTAQRLYEEVRAAGYTGCYSRVRDYVRQVRPQEVADPVVRFETPPGRQGQVDFGSFRLPWGRRHALLVVLGYSRLLWLRFFRRQTMEVLCGGLEGAFGTFGGVPQELLFDQMRSVVVADQRLAGGGLALNAEFLRFATHWGFRPRSCRPYRARTKGKVERPIRYVRRHGTTGERPQERFERDERRTLGPLAASPYRRMGTRTRAATLARLPEPVAVERRPLRVYAEVVR